MTESPPIFIIRPALPTDMPFIYATWLNHQYEGASWFRCIPRSIFKKNYRRIIDDIIRNKASSIHICCLEDDYDVILGYAVTQRIHGGHALHWIFVKEDWRRNGIAKKLIPDSIQVVTHLTDHAKRIKPKSWIYNPFLV